MKTYTGINIQWPISELILSGKKIVETRTYPIPSQYLNEDMILIETPGKSGKFKARMRAIIRFTNCFKYQDKDSFYRDSSRHCVDSGSAWAYDSQKGKWGWEVTIVRKFRTPKNLPRRTGIKYAKNLTI